MDDDRSPSLPGGKLEYAVLAALWEVGVATARDVHARVGLPLGLVYTTTARVLDRLQAKRLVAREKVGKLFGYRALVARPEVDGARLSQVLSGLLTRAPRPAMASLVDAIESIDPTLVDELAHAVELRREIALNRDLVFAALVLGLCGSAIWVAGWIGGVATFADRPLGESGRAAERRSWRRVWSPLVPAAVALAALCGWTIQEPRSTDELLRPVAWLGLIPLALIWLRAAFRAARALVPPRVAPVAATVGLLRPRVVMDTGLRRCLERLPLDAALAHERAHAHHRDPLRIWLAQIGTDLQWPNPSAQRRFDRWAETLELARDEEVRAGGVRGEDLAAALVAAVRLARAGVAAAAARLTGPERALCERIDRLLHPLRAPAPVGPRWLLPLTLLTALTAAGAFGVVNGDLLVRALPLITGLG